jgi:hypothetical protein
MGVDHKTGRGQMALALPVLSSVQVTREMQGKFCGYTGRLETLTGKPGKPSVPFPGGPSSPWGSGVELLSPYETLP